MLNTESRYNFLLVFPLSLSLIQVQTWAQQQGQRIQASLSALEVEREKLQRLLDWISSAEEALNLRDQEPPAESIEHNQELIVQHMV